MFPKLFDLPVLGWPINSYGFCIMVGFLLASWIATRRGETLGLKGDFILDVGIIGMVLGIVGAKINFLLQYPSPPPEPGKLSLWSDLGMNPLGALILGPIPFASWHWKNRISGLPVRLYSWRTALMLLSTVALAVAGAWGLHVIQHRSDYSWAFFRNWQSGFVLYGGLITGVAAGASYVKLRGQSVAQMADLLIGPMMLGVAFGRLGCFFNGCCYGRVGSGITCISFPVDSPAYSDHLHAGKILKTAHESLPVHPTQLYETVAGIAFFFILSWFWHRKRKAPGEVFLAGAILYAIWRFSVEFIRGDDRPLWIAGLSYSQVVSLAVALAAGIFLCIIRCRGKAVPTVQ